MFYLDLAIVNTISSLGRLARKYEFKY